MNSISDWTIPCLTSPQSSKVLDKTHVSSHRQSIYVPAN